MRRIRDVVGKTGPCEGSAAFDTEDIVNGEVIQVRKRPTADFLGFVCGKAVNAQKVFH
jgi:hypothetical protein